MNRARRGLEVIEIWARTKKGRIMRREVFKSRNGKGPQVAESLLDEASNAQVNRQAPPATEESNEH